MKSKLFLSFLFCVLSLSALSAKKDYKLLYHPCDQYTISIQELGLAVTTPSGKITQEVVETYTSVTYDWLSKFIRLRVKMKDIKILYDVSGVGKPDETFGACLVFTRDSLTSVLFNRGNKSYVLDKHQMLFAPSVYVEILYSDLTIEQIQKKFDVTIFPLTQESLVELTLWEL